METDAAENIKLSKKHSTERIDGAVASVMALDRAVRNAGQNQGSVYEDMSKGLRIVKFPIKENYSQDDEVIKSIKERYIEIA